MLVYLISSFPPDYGVTQVEAMTVLCHFCLLDSSTKNQPLVAYTGSSSQLFSSLTHLISPSPGLNVSFYVMFCIHDVPDETPHIFS